jgi:predicted metal-dependent phosphoesterase TrpH
MGPSLDTAEAPTVRATRQDSRRPVIYAAVVTVLVLLAWIVAVPAVRDGVTMRIVPGARLVLPMAYLVISPVCDMMDALSLLSVSQTLALLASLAVLYVAWRIVRWSRHGGSVGRELRLMLRALGIVVAFYGVGILAPRPMAALALADPDLVKVDLHSHTSFSHDGRPDFTPRANRAWHRAAGFDVAYVTDHRSFDGAVEGMRLNPPRAGDGLVVLSGLEFVENGVHINALGATERDARWFTGNLRDVRPMLPPGRDTAFVMLQTIPDDLARMPKPGADGSGGVLAIELSDGAPRGIQQGQRDRALILHLADSLNLAVVAGSNNHGWGRTAVAWSVMRIPGWRSLTPDALGAAIEGRIRAERREAVQVIERRSPDPGRSRAATAATLPAVAWNMLVTLSPAQRASWIVWSWALAALVTLRAGHRRTR